MKNVTFTDIETSSGVETHAIIENADGSFTSMTKAHYDEQQANQNNPVGGN